MGKYTFRDEDEWEDDDAQDAGYDSHDSGYDSGYESDEGTHYVPESTLGKGAYATARKFRAHRQRQSVDVDIANNGLQKLPMEKAVLSPHYDILREKLDFKEEKEVINKYLFFKTIYPQFDVRLFLTKDNYRLVLPLIPGVSYDNLGKMDLNDEIKLFIATVRAIKDCHEKGFVIVDLTPTNIHYDFNTGKSYLIDGGFATRVHDFIPSEFQLKDAAAVKRQAKSFSHYAPECWSTDGKVLARPAMDIYALGQLMTRIISNPLPLEIQQLISACKAADPAQRPTLDEIEKVLLDSLPDDIRETMESNIDLANQSFEHQDKEILNIFQKLEIKIQMDQLQVIHENIDLKNAILVFNALCEQLQYPANSVQARALFTYQKETLELILQGKDALHRKYDSVKEKAISAIEDEFFIKIARAFGNFVAMITVVGVIAMALTANQRGGFLLFRRERTDTDDKIDHIEESLRNLNTPE